MTARPLAVVTGAARGIGLAIAHRLADDHDVLRLDLDGDDLCTTTRTSFLDVACDVGDPDQLEGALDRVADRRIRVAVANAGIQRDARIERMGLDQWGQVLATDLTAAWLLVRGVWPAMLATDEGRIVLISSIAKDGNYGQANYSAAKSGLVGLARTAAIEGGPHGITTNVICPGVIETPGTAAFRTRAPAAFDRFLGRVPARRAGAPDEVAALASFFCAAESAYVNGQIVYVDGGLSCGHM